MFDKLDQNILMLKYQNLVVQTFFLVAPTSRFSSRKVRQAIIGKECGFTSQLLVEICSLKQLKYYLALFKISKNSEVYILRSQKDAKNSFGAQEINRFHIVESENIYESSKSSQSWLEKLRVTYTAYDQMRPHFRIQRCVSDRIFNQRGRWKSDRSKGECIKDRITIVSLIKFSNMILPPKISPLMYRRTGSTSRKLSFSLIHLFVEENK